MSYFPTNLKQFKKNRDSEYMMVITSVLEPDIFGPVPAPRTFTFLNVNRCRLPAGSLQGMNSYVDFTNQKSIVNPSSVGLLFVVQDAIIFLNKCKNLHKKLGCTGAAGEKIQNSSGSKGPKKPGSGSTT